MNGRMPWDKWSWHAWMTDAGLRQCNPAARGIWADMLAQMDASSIRGVLLVDGRPASTAEIARTTGNDRRSVERAIAQLERHGVFSRDETGAIFNRRMVNSWTKLQRDQANGRLAQAAKVGEHVESDADTRRKTPDARLNASSPRKIRNPVSIDINSIDRKGVHPEKRRREERRENGSPPAADSLKTEAAPLIADLVSGNAVVPFHSPTRAAFDAWNELAARLGLGTARQFTDHRKRLLAARLKECGGIDGFLAVLQEVEASDWLCGRLENRVWAANLDWLLRADRFHQVRDGATRWWGKSRPGSAGNAAHEWMAAGPAAPQFEFDGVTIDGRAEEA